MKLIDGILQDHTENGHYYIKPEIKGFDDRIKILYDSHIFDGQIPSKEKIIAASQTTELLCLDIEKVSCAKIDWTRNGGSADKFSYVHKAELNRDILADIADKIHEHNITVRLGYWSLMPMMFPGLMKSVLRSDFKQLPRYQAWKEQNASTRYSRDANGQFTSRGLSSAVDVIYPDCYWKSPDIELWKAQTRYMIEEAVKYDKAIYAFISGMIVQNTGITFVSKDEMKSQLDFMTKTFENQIQGIVVYGRPYTDHPWFEAVTEYI